MEGVLDWELSTLGHPLADLAYSALTWRLAADEFVGFRGLDLDGLSIPTEAEYLEHHYQDAPDFGRLSEFHIVFSLFRLAVIIEGVDVREGGLTQEQVEMVRGWTRRLDAVAVEELLHMASE